MSRSVRMVLCGVLAAVFGYAQGVPLPYTKVQFFSNSGQPLASGQVCTFNSGTTSPIATFTDYTLSTPNPQCVVLDSAGRASIWLNPAILYRVILKDSTGVTVWTVDGVSAAPGGSSTTALWTLNGSTVYNSAGSKVCIGTTPCTLALATLDVAGASSSGAGLIRIDDANSAPGTSLYGAGTLFGTYGASSAGLQLKSADGTPQLSIAQGAVTAFNAAASGGTTLVVKESATQATINPVQIQDKNANNLAYIDPSGNGFFPGLSVSGTATNSLQVPAGGITAQWLIGTDSLFLIEESTPPLSGAGQARIYADSGAHNIQVSQNGGAYTVLGSGGGGSTTFDLIGTGVNNSAKTMTVGSTSSLTFSGSGVVNASEINGTTVPTSPGADMVLITTAAGTGAWSGSVLNTTGLPNCTDTGGNHLNYNTSTHVWSCGTTGGTAGSVAFGAITTGTNSLPATMTVGAGSSLTFASTGVVNANQINGGGMPVSGSVTKTNGTLQLVQAGFADIVAMFAGGSGCSGTNALAANGTCVAGSGVTSVAGTSNQVFVNGGTGAQTGAVTLSLPQSIGTNSPVTFQSVTTQTGGAFNSGAGGSNIAFQTTNTNFQVDGNGNISGFGSVNLTGVGGYKIGGTTVIDNSRIGSFYGLLVSGGNLILNGPGGFLFAGSGSFASGVNFTGTILANGSSTTTGTTTCSSGHWINSITTYQGLVTNVTCN